MEPNNDKRKKRRKLIFLGLGVTAAGLLTFFGWDQYQKWKNKNTSDLDTDEQPPQLLPPPNSYLPTSPKPVANDEFPLRKGSKGTKVKQLQESLIAKYGKTILPKYGADGDFGNEVLAALKSKGLPETIDQNTFNVLVVARTFDAKSISDALYKATIAKDFSKVIRSLRQMKTTDDYSAVSENFKLQRVNGVHQTLVNALSTTFSGDQKQQIQLEFLRMGLKYDGNKWALSGIELKKIATIVPCLVWKDRSTAVQVPSKVILGFAIGKQNGFIQFQALQGGQFMVKSSNIKYL